MSDGRYVERVYGPTTEIDKQSLQSAGPVEQAAFVASVFEAARTETQALIERSGGGQGNAEVVVLRGSLELTKGEFRRLAKELRSVIRRFEGKPPTRRRTCRFVVSVYETAAGLGQEEK